MIAKYKAFMSDNEGHGPHRRSTGVFFFRVSESHHSIICLLNEGQVVEERNLFLPDMFNKHLYCFYCKLKRWCLIVTLIVCIFAFALFWIWKIQVCHNPLRKEQNPSHSIITPFVSGNQGDVGPPGPSGPPGEQGPEGECGYTGRISMLDDKASRILERAWATLILIASSIFVIK